MRQSKLIKLVLLFSAIFVFQACDEDCWDSSCSGSGYSSNYYYGDCSSCCPTTSCSCSSDSTTTTTDPDVAVGNGNSGTTIQDNRNNLIMDKPNLYFNADRFDLYDGLDRGDNYVELELTGKFVEDENTDGTSTYDINDCIKLYGFQMDYAPRDSILQKRSVANYSILQQDNFGSNWRFRIRYEFTDEEKRRLKSKKIYKVFSMLLFDRGCSQHLYVKDRESRGSVIPVFWNCRERDCDAFRIHKTGSDDTGVIPVTPGTGNGGGSSGGGSSGGGSGTDTDSGPVSDTTTTTRY